MPKSDGGPAFPRPVSEDRAQGDQPDGNRTIGDQAGMSLRDYFAAEAPAVPDWWTPIPDSACRGSSVARRAAEMERLAQWRYAYADAMLAARSRVDADR